MMTRLEHIGIAVENAGQVAKMLEDVLGYRPYKTEQVVSEGVKTVFLDAGGAKLELVEATDPDAALGKYVQKYGEGLHHLAFQVKRIKPVVERLKLAGYRIITEKPKLGADRKRVTFIHPKSTHKVLIELVEESYQLPEPIMVKVESEEVAVRCFGSPEKYPILLMHGSLGATALELQHMVEVFEKTHFVLALDFAGHGDSSDFKGYELSFELHRKCMLAVMDHFGFKMMDIFGFSMGGYVGLSFARFFPEKVRRLAMHAAHIYWQGDLESIGDDRLRSELIKDEFPTWAARMDQVHGEKRWPVLAHRMLTYFQSRHGNPVLRAEDLALIKTPILFSVGDRDPLVPLEVACRMVSGLPNAKLAVFPGIEHPLFQLDRNAYSNFARRHFALKLISSL